MTDEKSARHTNQDIWARVDQQSDQIGELARMQAATDANVAALTHSVDVGFKSIHASLGRIAERNDRPTNWVGVGGLIVVLVGSLLTFVTLQIEPINATQERTNELINRMWDEVNVTKDDLADRGVMIGEQRTYQDWHRSWLQSLEEQAILDRNMEAEIDRDLDRRVSHLEGSAEK